MLWWVKWTPSALALLLICRPAIGTGRGIGFGEQMRINGQHRRVIEREEKGLEE